MYISLQHYASTNILHKIYFKPNSIRKYVLEGEKLTIRLTDNRILLLLSTNETG